MRTGLTFLLAAAGIFTIFFSCQKEIHFDFVSEGTLVKDANNNCLGISHGDFISGKNLNGDNYIAVPVHVTAHGSYTVASDSVNGYYFKASGEFKDTGTVMVKLIAQGIPVAAGIDHFNISYNNSHCQVALTVADASTDASFVLQGAPGACIIDTINGVYLEGEQLTSNNTVEIKVNVSVPGRYKISTDTVNGYSFLAQGTFSATGQQTVSLSGKGKPVNTGSDVFTVSAGSSSCTIAIPVQIAVLATNSDHFPLTKSSYWDYFDLYYHGNIITNIVLDTFVRNGITYRAFMEEISPGGPYILYFRKNGSDYLEYAQVDKYTTSFQYNTYQFGELRFLKEGLGTGQQWQSAEFTGTSVSGQAINLQYNYTCLDANASLSISGHLFLNIYKVEMKPRTKSAGGNYADTGEIFDYYYAKGIGLIYYKKTDRGTVVGEWQLKDWQVN